MSYLDPNCLLTLRLLEQIKRVHGELGMGNVNINMKVGNIPDPVISNQIKIFGEKILPQVKNL